MPDFANPEVWISLLTLTTLEIVLGIDNIVFISIMARALPKHQQAKARQIGLMGALITRILLLLSISWVVGLTDPVFTLLEQEVSVRDMILFFGGIFLIVKGTHEIHSAVEDHDEGEFGGRKKKTMTETIIMIMILDIVFSLDSVITAVGMVDDVAIMITAITLAMFVMLWASKSVSEFIHNHPTVKMLALSFLLLIGMALVADGMHYHIPRGFIYFAIAFAIIVETLNLTAARNRKRVAHIKKIMKSED